MWGVPADHEMFKDINTVQWLWYYYNFMEDRKDAFEHDRDMVEYQASFIEPEAVRKIRESRDESVMVPDKEFAAGIEYFFGRKIDLPKERQKGTISSTVDAQTAARMSDMYKRTQKEKPKKVLDSRHWMDLDLE